MTTTSIDSIVSALSDLGGCGCCSSSHEAEQVMPDQCPSEDGYVNHTYSDGCVADFQSAVRAAIRIVRADALREAADLYPIRRHLGAQNYLRARADAIEADEETPA